MENNYIFFESLKIGRYEEKPVALSLISTKKCRKNYIVVGKRIAINSLEEGNNITLTIPIEVYESSSLVVSATSFLEARHKKEEYYVNKDILIFEDFKNKLKEMIGNIKLIALKIISNESYYNYCKERKKKFFLEYFSDLSTITNNTFSSFITNDKNSIDLFVSKDFYPEMLLYKKTGYTSWLNILKNEISKYFINPIFIYTDNIYNTGHFPMVILEREFIYDESLDSRNIINFKVANNYLKAKIILTYPYNSYNISIDDALKLGYNKLLKEFNKKEKREAMEVLNSASYIFSKEDNLFSIFIITLTYNPETQEYIEKSVAAPVLNEILPSLKKKFEIYVQYGNNIFLGKKERFINDFVYSTYTSDRTKFSIDGFEPRTSFIKNFKYNEIIESILKYIFPGSPMPFSTPNNTIYDFSNYYNLTNQIKKCLKKDDLNQIKLLSLLQKDDE